MELKILPSINIFCVLLVTWNVSKFFKPTTLTKTLLIYRPGKSKPFSIKILLLLIVISVSDFIVLIIKSQLSLSKLFIVEFSRIIVESYNSKG